MRIAILDLGTNTFHLLIVEQINQKNKTLFKSKVGVKLGEGAIDKKTIAPIPFRRGINTLKHFSSIIRKYKVEKVHAIATSAIRSAKNKRAFIQAAQKEAGIRIQTITGNQEAFYIYHGVKECVSLSDEKVLIMDIGGGSTEFIIADKNKIFWKKSFDIGAARLLEKFKPEDPIQSKTLKLIHKYLKDELRPLHEALKVYDVKTMIGSSGSFDTFAEMIGWEHYNNNIIKNKQSYRYIMKEYFALHKKIISSTFEERMKMKGLISIRRDMIVLSSICTNYILTTEHMKQMVLSKYALKEGVLSRLLNAKK